MKSGPELRASMNRRLKIEGEYEMDYNRTHIRLKGFEAVDSEGKTRKIVKEGDIVEIISTTSIRSLEPILTLRANPELYAHGNVRMLPVIGPADGAVQLGISFRADARLDLKKLDYLVEVYVNG